MGSAWTLRVARSRRCAEAQQRRGSCTRNKFAPPPPVVVGGERRQLRRGTSLFFVWNQSGRGRCSWIGRGICRGHSRWPPHATDSGSRRPPGSGCCCRPLTGHTLYSASSCPGPEMENNCLTYYLSNIAQISQNVEMVERELSFLSRLRSRCLFFGRSEPRPGAAFLLWLRLHLLGKQKRKVLFLYEAWIQLNL